MTSRKLSYQASDLRHDKDLAAVTLSCEDGKQQSCPVLCQSTFHEPAQIKQAPTPPPIYEGNEV